MTADPDPLPAGLADLLDNGFGPAGMRGVVADFLDEHDAFWAPFSTLLRASRLRADAGRGFDSGFRYRAAGPGVVFFVESVNHTSKWFGAPPDGDVLLGAYRTVPGREGVWSRVVPKAEVSDAARADLWALFPAPDASPPEGRR
ncbi:MAG: hypothetical protein K2X82_20675 [Gemmataceae bacterium]|nr:hypothetical protein [Gemmataceae bacterium]